MNWKEISEKYPKGFCELNRWLIGCPDFDFDTGDDIYEAFKIQYLTAYEDSPWNWRNLYDFFDENEIFIQPMTGITSLETFERKWMWEIHQKNFTSETDMMPCVYKTRTEAETAAFTKAFEILEIKLR